jgi:hypothetical protein
MRLSFAPPSLELERFGAGHARRNGRPPDHGRRGGGAHRYRHGQRGGAQHTDSMRVLSRRLGVLPVAETVHEARIDPAILKGRTLYDHRGTGPFHGTVLALKHNPSEFAELIDIRRLLERPGRTSLFRADEDTEASTGLVTAWVDDGLVIVAESTGRSCGLTTIVSFLVARPNCGTIASAVRCMRVASVSLPQVRRNAPNVIRYPSSRRRPPSAYRRPRPRATDARDRSAGRASCATATWAH